MIEFTPPDLQLSQYDGTELSPCFVSGSSVERILPGDTRLPSIWSVYLHLKSGGCECVADFDTKFDAQNFESFMLALIMEKKKL